MKVSKLNSSVEGDMPKPLLSRYPFQYSIPTSKIFNKVIQSGKCPRQWVKEHSIVVSKLEKSQSPASEEDLRTISNKTLLSKGLQNILCDFLLPIIEPFSEPGQ